MKYHGFKEYRERKKITGERDSKKKDKEVRGRGKAKGVIYAWKAKIGGEGGR